MSTYVRQRTPVAGSLALYRPASDNVGSKNRVENPVWRTPCLIHGEHVTILPLGLEPVFDLWIERGSDSKFPSDRRTIRAMNYSSRDFGRDLLKEIDKGCDPIGIAKWAFSLMMNPDIRTDPKTESLIITVVTMEAGPEFVFSEDDLRAMAQNLLVD